MIRFLLNPFTVLFILLIVFSVGYVLLDDVKLTPDKKVTTTIVKPEVKQILPNEASKKVISLKLKPETTVLVFGEIGEASSAIANRIISLSKSKEPITVLINSPGGSVTDGALIVSAIEASKAPVFTICMQFCASMAALIEEHGSKRYMVDRSVLMFHPATGSIEGTTYQMKSRLTSMSRFVDKLDAMVALRSGLPLETFLQMQSGELWIDAEDAVNQKFADGLVSLDLSLIDSAAFSLLGKASSESINRRFNIRLSDF